MKSTLPSPRLAAGQLISARDILLRRDCMSRLNEWLEAKGYCTRGVTIIELSNLIGTNRTTLSQFINQEYQLSFRDWINRNRCDEAIRQWNDMPNLTVDEVAKKCGFSSRKYFDLVFLACKGVSPSKYCKANKRVLLYEPDWEKETE